MPELSDLEPYAAAWRQLMEMICVDAGAYPVRVIFGPDQPDVWAGEVLDSYDAQRVVHDAPADAGCWRTVGENEYGWPVECGARAEGRSGLCGSCVAGLRQAVGQ